MIRDEIHEFVPHRGRNVLIDGFEDAGEGSGEGRLTIAEGDALGRDVFLTRGPDGPRYSPFFLVEHVGLASMLVIREETRGGRLAFFSTVSRFRGHAEAPAGSAIVSRVSRGRDRGDFRAFDARLETTDGLQVLDVSIMAYLAPPGSVGPSRRPGDGPPGGVPGDETLFPCVHPSVALLDRECAGVYPTEHPHVPGHFPGAPVMMGMAQWLAVAQAAALSAPAGTSEVAGAGKLLRERGQVAIEVAGLRAAVERDEEGRVTDLRLLATKRVAFRESIVPGDAYRAVFEPA